MAVANESAIYHSNELRVACVGIRIRIFQRSTRDGLHVDPLWLKQVQVTWRILFLLSSCSL
jgi:hypothetical protein